MLAQRSGTDAANDLHFALSQQCVAVGEDWSAGVSELSFWLRESRM